MMAVTPCAARSANSAPGSAATSDVKQRTTCPDPPGPHSCCTRLRTDAVHASQRPLKLAMISCLNKLTSGGYGPNRGLALE